MMYEEKKTSFKDVSEFLEKTECLSIYLNYSNAERMMKCEIRFHKYIKSLYIRKEYMLDTILTNMKSLVACVLTRALNERMNRYNFKGREDVVDAIFIEEDPEETLSKQVISLMFEGSEVENDVDNRCVYIRKGEDHILTCPYGMMLFQTQDGQMFYYDKETFLRLFEEVRKEEKST